jgi:hypothetical protein
VAYEVKRNFSLLEKSLEIQIVTVGRGLAGYARFHSLGCKTQGLKFTMKIFVKLGQIPMIVVVNNHRGNFLTGSSQVLVVVRLCGACLLGVRGEEG